MQDLQSEGIEKEQMYCICYRIWERGAVLRG